MKNDEIKLLRGNCLELAEQIPDGSIDMVLCDPPYGVTDCRRDSVLPFNAMWRMYERVVKANGTIALDAYKPLNGRWGLIAGFHVESKGMKTDAKVKNYHMEIRQGGETLDGMFTGNVVTDVDMWMVTLPLQATYTTGKVRLKAGPFLSYLLSSNFSGYAYDGHLRVGNPTGTRVDLGTDEASRGTYDFSDDLRRVHFGVDVGADWQFSRRYGAYADLSWGLIGAFKRDFKTIEQTMYPIFGSIGITYKFN